MEWLDMKDERIGQFASYKTAMAWRRKMARETGMPHGVRHTICFRNMPDGSIKEYGCYTVIAW